MVLGKEVADVDTFCFEKIGYVEDGILAAPDADLIIALKGQASCVVHNFVDCQNTLFLYFEAPTSNVIGNPDFDDALEPGAVYRYRGDDAGYQNRDFVELKHKEKIGAFTLVAYFLVCTDDCKFAIAGDEDNGDMPCTFADLWKEGYIMRVNNG
ncbi:MAG: hypothetical protein ACXAC5_01175 [Promethearchaeota archaeon]|jgi:hypothetical protein